MAKQTVSRRAFLAAAGAFVAHSGCATRPNTARVVPRKISPNERLNIALVGCGGRGYENLRESRGENVVALCDIDPVRAGKALSEHPGATRYNDWRALFEHADTFDAVIVSTPDHTHAPASVTAMRLGKHVYCEKPLARTIHEARVMAATARECNVATQMGTQGVSYDNTRKGIELLRAGIIGAPREIHVWTDRATTWWPQGVERPVDSPAIPEQINWDVWIGAAPVRPYHPAYHPFKWRGWKDFGSGAIGDMGIHNAAIAYLGLGLGMPDGVTIIKSSPLCAETFPTWAELCFSFPASGANPALKMFWYDGGHKPPNTLINGGALDGNGCIIVGEKGTLYSVDWAGDVHHFYPEEIANDFAATAREIASAGMD